ncbi:MAG: hypothetical protein JO222_01755, partial [Frankiales bacterium]|nr:hypothetical protein [Frankiales bacterium]
MRIRRPAALTAVAAAALVAPVITATHAVGAPASKRFLKVRVMTYNILELTRDGEMMKGGSRVAPWSQRKYAVARYIHSVEPGIVAIQEGSSWVAQKKGPRQVDSLVNALGGDYGLAHTETPPWQRHFLRTGRYLLYRKALYAPVGQGWHRDLGKKSWMAYQEFKDKATGLRFLATSSHLFHLSGTAANNERYMETKRLI